MQIASNLAFVIVSPPPPPNAIRKKTVQFGNPETIRENLQIDSRESGHLRVGPHGRVGMGVPLMSSPTRFSR